MVSSQHIVTLRHVTNARRHLLFYIVNRPLRYRLHIFTHHVLDKAAIDLRVRVGVFSVGPHHEKCRIK